MNRKLISKAISDIDDSFIAESLSAPVTKAGHTPERTKTMGKYENQRKRAGRRSVIGLAAAACLVFSLTVTAYAMNMFGIREMFRTQFRELPQTADPHIQHHTEATAAQEEWSARVTESLCDTGKILTTVSVSCNEKYILVSHDWTADDYVSVIGLEGTQTLREYAQEQGRTLLFVSASLMQNEHLGVFTETQNGINVSTTEINILVESGRTGEEAGDAICKVYAWDGVGEPKVLDIPFSLEAAPSDNERVFVPMEPNAIHGLTLGEATVKDTPLGLSVRWLVSVTSEDVWDLVMKVEIDGVTYREGGFVQADDGNHYFQFAMGEGTIGDTMIVHFYDWDKQPIGDITFVKK